MHGRASEATFTRVDSIVSNSRGTLFILDGNKCIRQLEDGRVTTLLSAVSSGPEPVDGPLDKARFHMIGLGGNLTGGENDDVLYLSDHWNFVARRIDLESKTVSTVAGMPKPAGESPREQRFNTNAAGPALTWASFNSGCAYVCWDPIHQALRCGGVVWQRHHLCGEKWTNFENCDIIAARVSGYKSRDPQGVPAAASTAEEQHPALASSGDGRLLLVYERHEDDGRVVVAGRRLRVE